MPEEQQKNHRFKLLDMDPRKGMNKLAIPMIIAFLFQTGFNIVDTIFVGRLGAEAIAGVSLAFPFQMFIISLCMGVGVGAQSLIARSIGANVRRDANKAAGNAIVLAMLLSIVTTIVGLTVSPYLVSTLGASAKVTDECIRYLTPILVGSIFMFLSINFNFIFRGEGDTKRPMYFMAIGAVSNIILDPIFIFTLDMGVAGAAYATVIARAIATLIIFYDIFVRKRTYVRFNREAFRLNFGIIRRIIDVGIPASLAQLSLSMSLFFLNDMVSPFGDAALAAFGIGFRVESVVFLPMIGFSGAFVSAVGFFKGSHQPEKINLIHRYSLKVLILFMVVCSLLFYAFPELIYNIFSSDTTVVGIGKDYLRTLSIFYPILPFSLLAASGFQGLGRGFPSLGLALIRSGIVSVPLSFMFTMVYGMPVRYIWLSIAIGDAISALVGHLWFKKELSGLGNDITKNI